MGALCAAQDRLRRFYDADPEALALWSDVTAAACIAGALNWCQDWSGTMYTSNNSGLRNAYWYADPDGTGSTGSMSRFEWASTPMNLLANFNATPGGQSGRYLSSTEKDQVLTAATIPPTAKSR